MSPYLVAFFVLSGITIVTVTVVMVVPTKSDNPPIETVSSTLTTTMTTTTTMSTTVTSAFSQEAKTAVQNWVEKVNSRPSSVSIPIQKAHVKFYQKLIDSGLLQKIVRLSTFSGDDINAPFVPLIPGSGLSIDTPSSSYAMFYKPTTGLKQASGYLKTGQYISFTNFLDDTSSASNGEDLHMSVFSLDSLPTTSNGEGQDPRLMGVYQKSEAGRHYIIGPNLFWGQSIGSAQSTFQSTTAGFYTVTGSTTPQTAYAYFCSVTGSTCTQSKKTNVNVDKSQPSNLPVTIFASSGSINGENPAFADNIEINGEVKEARLGGYTIGKGLTATDVENLFLAFKTLNTDLGRS
jgi:hypothetical protein